MATGKKSANHWPADLTAGLTTGIANIPDAMASAILAGTNPVYGLNGLMAGTPVGALITSSHFMSVVDDQMKYFRVLDHSSTWKGLRED